MFSEKSLRSLGEHYVYGLIDPRNNRVFYIGKGTDNRIFEHERESLNSPDSEKLKLKTISDIKAAGLDVHKVIINWNLTEDQALAAEASLINIFNYVGCELTNVVSGHHSSEALSVENYEKEYGAPELYADDIKHNILIIKINQLYKRNIDEDALYDAVRGVWKVSAQRVKKIDYVFGVYNSLIVAVYKPTEWFACKDARDKLPRQNLDLKPEMEERLFFVDENYKHMDENAKFYFNKSIAKLKLNARNPIQYIGPKA